MTLKKEDIDDNLYTFEVVFMGGGAGFLYSNGSKDFTYIEIGCVLQQNYGL